MRRASIVVDLGFGDAGKGLLTDYFARTTGATLVVRFNGGAQAGHNVVTADGRHHTFAQLAAASFVPGVRTHLARTTIVHPTALLVEAARLADIGVPGALAGVSVSGRALVVTPFHQAVNRLRELARGADRHGSCGAGVGEVVADALAAPEEAIHVEALLDTSGLRVALRRLASRKHAEVATLLLAAREHDRAAADAEARIFEDPGVVDRWISAVGAVLAEVRVVDDAWLARELERAPAVVFEGAQGVLLDEWAGFHPHTTWSTCTFANALELLRDARYDGEITRVGVLRTYPTRHGHGPFPTADASLVARLPEPHNEEGPWQGRVRRGWPDAILARYAARAAGGIDALALTHLDALARVAEWKVCRAYRVADEDAGGPVATSEIAPPIGQDLERQARVALALSRVTPAYEPVAWNGAEGAERAVAFFEEAVEAKARWTSTGPRFEDVATRR